MKSSPHNWVQSPVYPKQPRFFCSLLNCQTKHLQDCWSHPFREIIPYLVTVLTHAKGMIIQVDTAVSLQQNHRGSMCIWMGKRHIHMFWASANQESGYIFSNNSTKKNRAPHVFFTWPVWSFCQPFFRKAKPHRASCWFQHRFRSNTTQLQWSDSPEAKGT